jgi:hypothetical protein
MTKSDRESILMKMNNESYCSGVMCDGCHYSHFTTMFGHNSRSECRRRYVERAFSFVVTGFKERSELYAGDRHSSQA